MLAFWVSEQPIHGKPRFVILLGLRASGKTILGPVLAEQIGGVFLDLDDHSGLRLQSPNAAAAIRAHGFEKFRVAESQALETALAMRRVKPTVLALGGGTPTFAASRERLAKARAGGALLIYLHASPQVLRARLEKTDTSKRPSITGAGVVDEVDTVYRERDALYREVAAITIDAEGAPAATVEALVRAVNPGG